MPKARVTITLPGEVIREIDRRERNRSRFVLEAVEHELELRRRHDLLASLESPHPQSEEIAEAGFTDWADWGEAEDRDLLGPETGAAVRWSRDRGWEETGE